MKPLHDFAPAAIATLVRDAPLTSGKLAFAWRTAVGPAMDRATDIVRLEGGVLEIRAADQHWRREIRRSMPLVLDRLAALLGAGTVSTVKIMQGSAPQAPR